MTQKLEISSATSLVLHYTVLVLAKLDRKKSDLWYLELNIKNIFYLSINYSRHLVLNSKNFYQNFVIYRTFDARVHLFLGQKLYFYFTSCQRKSGQLLCFAKKSVNCKLNVLNCMLPNELRNNIS